MPNTFTEVEETQAVAPGAPSPARMRASIHPNTEREKQENHSEENECSKLTKKTKIFFNVQMINHQ